jgi:signal transduction histidine kinase
MSIKVVIVEDERLVARDIANILQDEGYIVCAIASDGLTALKHIIEHSPDLVLLDIRIKGEIDGIDVAQFLQSFYDSPIIYLTSFSDSETLKRAQSTNPAGYVVKPFRREQLLSSITIALSTYTYRKQNSNEYIKHQFLSIISNEIRNPINAILGFSECLKKEMMGAVNAEQIEALQVINDSGNHLLYMINNILDLSMLEAGKLQLQFDLSPITPTCRTALEYIQPELIRKDLQLEMQISDHLPYLMLDERRIFQVLIHLLKNAIKFTPNKGYIKFEVNLSQHANLEDTSSIQIVITDTGVGISPTAMEQLFQPFSQINNQGSRTSGMGLGLIFVKRIVELHGGQVSANSTVSKGSRFTVTLPCKVPSNPFSYSHDNLFL